MHPSQGPNRCLSVAPNASRRWDVENQRSSRGVSGDSPTDFADRGEHPDRRCHNVLRGCRMMHLMQFRAHPARWRRCGAARARERRGRGRRRCRRGETPAAPGTAGCRARSGRHRPPRTAAPPTARRPIPAGGGAPFGRGGEAGGPGVEIALEHLHQHRLDRDLAVLAALAADVDDGALVGSANVTDVGAHQFIGAQPGQQRGQDEGAVAFASSRCTAAAPGPNSGQPAGPPPHRSVAPWAASWRVWAGRPSAWVGRNQLRGVEAGPQHVPGRPAPLNQRGLMGFRILRERGAQGVDGDGARRHTRTNHPLPAMGAAIVSKSLR